MTSLRYYGTTDDVRLGDRVEMRSLFRRRQGIVTYIPTMSARELQALSKDADEWIITMGETSYGILYSPEDSQPPRHIRLISRGPIDFQSLSPDDLESHEVATHFSPWGALGCIVFAVVVGLAVSLVVVWFRS